MSQVTQVIEQHVAFAVLLFLISTDKAINDVTLQIFWLFRLVQLLLLLDVGLFV